ncbi:hypothetical protein ACHAC9_13295 [Massilia sp. CMS3.1]|uniref:hypothetical protein n=1 Tax=Massilia sp. CMS3.1 TaxID=3373083 RepID=UPI003EE562A2
MKSSITPKEKSLSALAWTCPDGEDVYYVNVGDALSDMVLGRSASELPVDRIVER